MVREIKYGTMEQPQEWFLIETGRELGKITQTQEKLEFAALDLENSCETGIFQKVSDTYEMKANTDGFIISYAFVSWKDKESDWRPPLVVNL